MTLHPKKSSTKKATVQSSITNYFTPNSNSRTAKAPPRPSASTKSAESSKPPKEKKNALLNGARRENKERGDDAEILDVVSDDDADFFRDSRPIKRSRRMISDEDDLFAPLEVSSSYKEAYDESGPSTPFQTTFTPGSCNLLDPFPFSSTNFQITRKITSTEHLSSTFK